MEGVSGRTSGGFGKEFLPPSSFLSIHNYSPPPTWQERGDRKGWNHKHNPIKSRCGKRAKKWSRADPQISRWICGCFVLGRLILSRIGYSHIFHPLLTPSHFFLSLPAGCIPRSRGQTDVLSNIHVSGTSNCSPNQPKTLLCLQAQPKDTVFCSSGGNLNRQDDFTILTWLWVFTPQYNRLC